MSKYTSSLLHKTVVMGNEGVGKSALTLRFMYDEFDEGYEPTIAENYRKNAKIEDRICLLDILDTAGYEDYNVVREAYYKDGEGFLLVFAINDEESFTALGEFHDQILRVKGADKHIPFLLVGNKVDLEDYRLVLTLDAEKCASKWNCPYIETSAKSCENVQEVFLNMFLQIQNSKPEPGLRIGVNSCCTIM